MKLEYQPRWECPCCGQETTPATGGRGTKCRGMEREVNITAILAREWPDTDLSLYHRARQAEFCQRWLRQFMTWLATTRPRGEVLEGALAAELAYREHLRHEAREEKRAAQRVRDTRKRGK